MPYMYSALMNPMQQQAQAARTAGYATKVEAARTSAYTAAKAAGKSDADAKAAGDAAAEQANLAATGGRRRSRRSRKSTLKAKTLRRMCKKKGLKTTGRKATLMKRLHLKGGGSDQTTTPSPTAAKGDTHGYPGGGYLGPLARA